MGVFPVLRDSDPEQPDAELAPVSFAEAPALGVRIATQGASSGTRMRGMAR